ncbi:MAG: fumarylacetoacetate hydrolase family protein [Clostridium sp.]
MRILTYQNDEKERLGFLSEDGKWVYPADAAGLEYRNMKELIEGISDSEIQLAEHIAQMQPYETEIRGVTPIEDARILAPIPDPDQDIICLGVNYLDHAKEAADFLKGSYGEKQAHAVYFGKRVNRASGQKDEIFSYPGFVDGLDYEAELAVVIGKDAKDVPEENAQDYIFGYTVLNDVSARNIQESHGQWYFGKSLDGFTPMGPWIVTANEIAFPPKLSIQSKVNGELRQNGNTGDLVFGIDHIISELSKGMTLRAGTIISTGTPAGAGIGFTPPKFLKPGDTVECTIEKIGSLINKII